MVLIWLCDMVCHNTEDIFNLVIEGRLQTATIFSCAVYSQCMPVQFLLHTPKIQ